MMQDAAIARWSKLGLALLGSVLALALVTGCGGGGTDEQGAPSSFSATVEGAYGPVTVSKQPERVVTLTMSSADIVNSLGVKPVAYALDATPGTEPGQVPWLPDLDRGSFDESMITAEYAPSAESIGVHQPDLIIAASHLVDEASYRQLSQIAPTYVPPTGDGRDFTDDIAAIGALTGRAETAQQVQADLDAEFATARETLAGLQGKTFNWVQWIGTMVQWHRTNWTMEQLGLVPGEGDHPESGRALQLSLEEVEQIDGDVVVMVANEENARALAADPRVAELPASQNGALVVVEVAVHYASLGGYAGPSSVTWTLSKLVPPLAATDLNQRAE